MRPPSNITAMMTAGIKKITAGFLAVILTRMPAVILVSGAAALQTCLAIAYSGEVANLLRTSYREATRKLIQWILAL